MLKEFRKQKNLSQEDLERITGLDRKTIFRIENDLCYPTLDTFSKIVTALELSDEEIAKIVKDTFNNSYHNEA